MKNILQRGALVALVMASGIGAFAQDGPPPPPPGQDGGPGFGGPGFGGPGRGRRGGRELTAATVPLPAMEGYLSLSATQKSKISAIHAELQKSRPLPPRFDPNGGGEPPAPPTREEMQERMAKMQETERKAKEAVEAILTDAQKAKLPTLLAALSALRAERFDLAATPKLRLTDSQWEKLATLGKNAKPGDAAALLTDDQLAVIEENLLRRGPGGFGGPGGGPPPPGQGGPGGFGGPPPQ